VILFRCPTGFGKTGVLLECAPGPARAPATSTACLLTTSPPAAASRPDPTAMTQRVSRPRPPPVTAGTCATSPSTASNARPSQCVRDECAFSTAAEARWPPERLARFYLLEKREQHDWRRRAAGAHAVICPTDHPRRARVQRVWIGDHHNYVLARATACSYTITSRLHPHAPSCSRRGAQPAVRAWPTQH